MAAAGVDEPGRALVAVAAQAARHRRGRAPGRRGRLRPVRVRPPGPRGRRPAHLRPVPSRHSRDWVRRRLLGARVRAPEAARPAGPAGLARVRHRVRRRVDRPGPPRRRRPGGAASPTGSTCTSTCSAPSTSPSATPPRRSPSGGTSTSSASCTPTSSTPTSPRGRRGPRSTEVEAGPRGVRRLRPRADRRGAGCPTSTRACRPTCCPPRGRGRRAAETFFALHRLLAGPAHDFVTAEAGAARPG